MTHHQTKNDEIVATNLEIAKAHIAAAIEFIDQDEHPYVAEDLWDVEATLNSAKTTHPNSPMAETECIYFLAISSDGDAYGETWESESLDFKTNVGLTSSAFLDGIARQREMESDPDISRFIEDVHNQMKLKSQYSKTAVEGGRNE